MAKSENIVVERVSVEHALKRLKVVLEAVDEMQPNEREAAFKYLKDRYRAEWPSDPY